MTTETHAQLIAQGRALAARKSTEALLLSLSTLVPKVKAAREKASISRNYDECQVLNLMASWVVHELEERYPAAADAVNDAFDAAGDDDAELDYDALLIAEVRKIAG